MRLHRFYVGESIGERTEVVVDSVELLNQIQHVFRLGKGDSVIIFDGSGFDYECEIVSSDKKSLILKVKRSEASRFMPMRDIGLYQAIVKKDNFEWIVEKATELGVTNIIPVIAERSEKKALNEDRLNKIAIEASEQSGRGNVPKIFPIVELEDIVKGVASGSCLGDNSPMKKIVFHTEGDVLHGSDSDTGTCSGKTTKDLAGSDLQKRVAVFIGPEGGWSDKEMELFHKNGFEVRCLGKQVLRSETAVIAALSTLVF